MKAVIVDDEYLALQGLKMKLLDIGEIEVAGMYDDVEVFLHEIKNIKPDVAFLDIEMPKMNGFEILERLLDMDISTHIVFVTAHSHYAAQAFEVSAMDYIVKPVTKERLIKALNRVRSQLQRRDKIEISDNSIKINCFRSFSIMYGNKEFNTGWKTKKSEELLAYLICEKGKITLKEKISYALWPEENTEKSTANLHVAYYYLKQQEKKMGVNLPIESKRGTMRFLIDKTTCDIMDFDEYCKKSEDKKVPQALQVEYMEKAVHLYNGGLFEDRYYEWCLSYQQQYEMKYEGLLSKLVQHYDNISNIKKQKYYNTLFLMHAGQEES